MDADRRPPHHRTLRPARAIASPARPPSDSGARDPDAPRAFRSGEEGPLNRGQHDGRRHRRRSEAAVGQLADSSGADRARPSTGTGRSHHASPGLQARGGPGRRLPAPEPRTPGDRPGNVASPALEARGGLGSASPDHPGSHRLRIGRYSVGAGVYHLRFTTRGRRPLLRDFRAARLATRMLARVCARGLGRSLCHVVMPDHVHWLVQLHADSLADLVRPAKSLSAMAINRHLGRTGAVWQASYFDRALRPSEPLVAIARYILRNPVRAGLVSRIGDWPHWDAIWLEDRWHEPDP